MAENGLVIVYTGGGKGKTTAALGMALRACGYDHRICIIQFIKGTWHYGEMDSVRRLGPNCEMIAAGGGFVGIIDDKSPKELHQKIAGEAVATSRERIISGRYDLVILDEINYAVKLGLIGVEDVAGLIRDRPDRLSLVLTGNHARPEIIEMADLVTEMKEVKHPYRRGIKAKKGIDF